jgi:hypothetical protein
MDSVVMCIFWHKWTKWKPIRVTKYRVPRYYQGQVIDYYYQRCIVERRFCLNCEKVEERERET